MLYCFELTAGYHMSTHETFPFELFPISWIRLHSMLYTVTWQRTEVYWTFSGVPLFKSFSAAFSGLLFICAQAVLYSIKSLLWFPLGSCHLSLPPHISIILARRGTLYLSSEVHSGSLCFSMLCQMNYICELQHRDMLFQLLDIYPLISFSCCVCICTSPLLVSPVSFLLSFNVQLFSIWNLSCFNRCVTTYGHAMNYNQFTTVPQQPLETKLCKFPSGTAETLWLSYELWLMMKLIKVLNMFC